MFETPIFQPDVAKTIKIGLKCGLNHLASDPITFREFLETYVLSEIKFCKEFRVIIDPIPKESPTDYHDYSVYNYIFYHTRLSMLADPGVVDHIKTIATKMIPPRQHLFVVVDQCSNMMVDDDGDLVLEKVADKTNFNFLTEALANVPAGVHPIFKVNLTTARIWKTIDNQRSLKALTEDDIDILIAELLKKSPKMDLLEKKKCLKGALKKINFEHKIGESGYLELIGQIGIYLKLSNQKKIVCLNYLFYFGECSITTSVASVEYLERFLNEVKGILYFKKEILDDLMTQLHTEFMSKVEKFINSHRTKVSIQPLTTASVPAHKYHKILICCEELAVKFGINPTSTDFTFLYKELDTINKLILDHHSKELEKITDLEKIASLLEILSKDSSNNLSDLFQKIIHNSKIMTENIDNMSNWCDFIDDCFRLKIPINLILNLVEEIIVHKISYYSGDLNRVNKSDLTAIYPQCLHIFLLQHLNEHFVFVKLSMYASYAIRYSGRNIIDLMRQLTPEQYQSLLLLETKLVSICESVSNPEVPTQNQAPVITEV